MTRLYAISLLLVGCSDFELPPRIASSEYIDYHTDVDASVICMDDLLASEDRFIERTAALLGVDQPSRTIDFVWDPEQDGAAPWACVGESEDCYQQRTGGIRVVVSTSNSQHHELTHAVEAQGLGTRAHRVLVEGVAEYLGTLKVSSPSDDFPAQFKALLATGPRTTGDYKLAMHFVGSIFTRHGAEKYRALRARMPEDAGPEQFAEVFAAEFGQPLDDALVEMAGELVRGNGVFRGCGEGEAPALAWTDEGVLDTTIVSTCGDPGFFGTGFVDDRPGFVGMYQVEVTRAGIYALTIGGVEGSVAPGGALLGCFYDSGAVGSLVGQGLLEPGTFLLVLQFPQRPEARGEATVRLEYVGPP